MYFKSVLQFLSILDIHFNYSLVGYIKSMRFFTFKNSQIYLIQYFLNEDVEIITDFISYYRFPQYSNIKKLLYLMGNQQKRCSEFCSPGNNNQQTVAEIQIDGNNQIFPHKISQFKQVCQIYKKLGYSDQWLSQMPYKFPDSNTYYYGQFKKNLPFGYGRLINENGSFFQGEFLQGKVYCKNGLFIYPNGSYYLGQIKSNKANGNGIFVYNNNKLVQYQGEWLNDSPHGQGIEYFSDGTKYQGQFYNGIKQGNGKFTWPNGDYYIGQFSQGLIQGKGNFFCNETNYKYSGEWKKNKKNGIGIQYFDDGTKYEGNFVNNMRIGKCKILNNEEVVYEGQYQKINKEQSF